jgi:hypothetical protein
MNFDTKSTSLKNFKLNFQFKKLLTSLCPSSYMCVYISMITCWDQAVLGASSASFHHQSIDRSTWFMPFPLISILYSKHIPTSNSSVAHPLKTTLFHLTEHGTWNILNAMEIYVSEFEHIMVHAIFHRGSGHRILHGVVV